MGKPVKIRTISNIIRGGQLKHVPLHYFYTWLRGRQVLNTPPKYFYPADTENALSLHILSGSRNVTDLLFAAKSFASQYPGRIVLTVHDDSSMARADFEMIAFHCPGATVISRKEADDVVESDLTRRELFRLLEFRRSVVHVTKLVDPFYFSRSDRIMLLDTDVLSFGDLTEIYYAASEMPATNTFGRDPELFPYVKFNFGYDLPASLNSGCAIIARGTMDMECIEYWLSGGFPTDGYWSDQTILAALAARAGYRYLSPLYNMGCVGPICDARLVHYCGHKLSRARIEMRIRGQARVLNNLKSVAAKL